MDALLKLVPAKNGRATSARQLIYKVSRYLRLIQPLFIADRRARSGKLMIKKLQINSSQIRLRYIQIKLQILVRIYKILQKSQIYKMRKEMITHKMKNRFKTAKSKNIDY